MIKFKEILTNKTRSLTVNVVMKKQAIFGVVLFLLTALPAAAQTPTESESKRFGRFLQLIVGSKILAPTGVRQVKEMGGATTTPSTKLATPTGRPEQFRMKTTQMLDSFAKRETQYVEFLGKLRSRRDKLEQGGKDVTKTNEFLDEATKKHAVAKLTLENEKRALESMDLKGDAMTVRKSIKDRVSKIRTAFTEMHKSMSETVRAAQKETVESSNTGGGKLMQDVPARPTKTMNPVEVRPTKTLKPVEVRPTKILKPTIEVPPPFYDK